MPIAAEDEVKSSTNTEYSYDKDFLSKEEADALFTLAQSFPRERPLNKLSGFKYGLRRLQMPCYSATPNWRGSENEKTNQWMMPLDEAPAEVKSLAEKLSNLAGKPVNYFSFVGYENEKDHIGWHQHGEDKCRDARVFIVSLGEVRTFGIRKLCDECRVCDDCNKRMCAGETQPSCAKCRVAHKHRKTCEACKDKSKWILLQPEHGSLITLPDSYNNTHEHAVLNDKGPKGFRVSINTKHISAADITAGNGYIPKEHRHGGPTSKTEVVHCMKEKYDVYIGRRNVKAGLPESPFANRSNGDYRTYFLQKLRDDTYFPGKVLKLHGKKLGCWCKGTSRDFSECHGHIVAEWADKLRAKWTELKPDKVAMRSWLDEVIANELGNSLRKPISPMLAGLPKTHGQDTQNCLCEFDKYQRIRRNEGEGRKLVPSSQPQLLREAEQGPHEEGSMTTDPLDEIEPFTEIQLSTATTLDDQFLEFLGSGNYCWNHNSHMDLKPASYRKYRGAGVSIAWEYHDDTRNNFGIWIEGEKPYFSKNYQDARLCSAAAFAKVMLLTGADRDEVVAWWNKRKGIEESHKESI